MPTGAKAFWVNQLSGEGGLVSALLRGFDPPPLARSGGRGLGGGKSPSKFFGAFKCPVN